MASTLDPKKKLALAICDFLSTSLKDGTINADDSENIEIATNCIAEAFHIDPTNTEQVKTATGAQNLLQIYSVYDKLKTANPPPSSSSKQQPASSSSKAGGNDAAASSSGAATTTPESESLKSKGNEAMRSHNYAEAINLYTSALTISPTNPIYLSNRAAAYSAQQNYSAAASDAELATASDPSYAKGWSRLGAAKYALGEWAASVQAYEKAVEIDGSEMSKKGLETARRKQKESETLSGGAGPEDDIDDAPGASRGAGAGGMPDLGALAGMFGGGGAGGGGGGGGGMPDLASLMNNPMMAQMAQKLMSDPQAMQGLMQNPQVRAMAENMGLGGLGGGGGGGGGASAGAGAGAGRGAGGAGRGGGGMPDLSAMMQDPAMQEMAKKFMGGGAGGAGRGA